MKKENTEYFLYSDLLQYGANPCLKNYEKDSVLSYFIETVPNECSTILTNFMVKSNHSLAAKNLELQINFQVWENEWINSESDGLLRYKFLQFIHCLKNSNFLEFLEMVTLNY